MVDDLDAFDGAISSSGADDSNEIVGLGAPEIWLQLRGSEATGQDIRATTLVGKGLGIVVERFDDQAMFNAIESLLTLESCQEKRAKMPS